MFAVYVSLGIASIFLNTVFLVVLWRKSKVSVVHKHYLCNLGISNLGISFLCLNWDIRNRNLPTDTPPWVCVLQFYGVQICLFTTLGTVIAMSVDKCIGIRRAVLYKTICTVKNTRVALGVVWVTAVLSSLLPTEDFVDNLRPACTILDLYPRRYASLLSGTITLVYLIGQLATLCLLVVSLVKYFQTRRNDFRHNREILAKKRRATRIILFTSALYSLTVIPLIAFFYWIGQPSGSFIDKLTHDFTLAANCFIIIFTFIDPFIYFLCVLKFRMSRQIQPLSTDTSSPFYLNATPPCVGASQT